MLAPTCTLIIALLSIFGVVDNDKGILITSAIDTFLGAVVTIAKKLYDEKEDKKEEVLDEPKEGWYWKV